MKVAKIIATCILGGILLCGYSTDLLAMEQDNTDYQTCYDPEAGINIVKEGQQYYIYSNDKTINWIAEATDEVMYTSCDVFARTFPNISNKNELCLSAGTPIIRVGKSSNGWDIIKYQNKEYFMWTAYIVAEVPAVEQVAQLENNLKAPKLKKSKHKSIQGVIKEPLELPYTETDITYMWRCVETETYGADFESKTHVASVIINRVDNGGFGSSPYEVITSPYQFAYFRTSISDSTKEAVDYVLMNGDTARGALFFHSNKTTATFCGRSLIFTDSCGHNFY